MKEQVPEWLKNKDYFNIKKDAAIEIYADATNLLNGFSSRDVKEFRAAWKENPFIANDVLSTLIILRKVG